MDNKRARFDEIANDYFKSMTLMPTREAWDKTLEGMYHNVCSMKTFTKTDEPTDLDSYQLVIAIADWLNFVSRTQALFENKVSFRRLDFTISEMVCSLKEFPFTNQQISQYTSELYEWVNRQYRSAYVALVPVYNLVWEDGIDKLSLANGILCRGSDNSLVAALSKQERIKSLINFKQDVDYLAIKVSGDGESANHIARLEANRSLGMLRFISNWTQHIKGLNYSVENEASCVSLFPTHSMDILYYDPEVGTDYAGMSGTGRSIYYVSKDKLDDLRGLYDLDSLNYHFQKEANPVSNRIIRGFELYDSGVCADSTWQSLYRYVACINTIVLQSRSKEEEITAHLRKLIEFGGNFVGPMDKLDETAGDIVTLTWNELVAKTAYPFKDFYVLRGKILHGDILQPSLEEVSNIRILANNSIRLMAKLAHEFNWNTKRDIDNWFRNPSYPPSVIERMEHRE